MEAKTGKFGPFHSHKLENGSWCNGKGAKVGPPSPLQQTQMHSGSTPQQRAWGKSKQLQIRLQGLVQAIIASGNYEKLNQTDYSGLIKLAATIAHQIEEFADQKVGFDRAADQLAPGGVFYEVEDIPF
jgi:hypothetical protein